jgi:hypothetical protein
VTGRCWTFSVMRYWALVWMSAIFTQIMRKRRGVDVLRLVAML